MQISEQIKMVRIHKGLTQSELSAVCGCSRETISNIERGIHFPSVELIAKISLKLDFSFTLKGDIDKSVDEGVEL